MTLIFKWIDKTAESIEKINRMSLTTLRKSINRMKNRVKMRLKVLYKIDQEIERQEEAKMNRLAGTLYVFAVKSISRIQHSTLTKSKSIRMRLSLKFPQLNQNLEEAGADPQKINK